MPTELEKIQHLTQKYRTAKRLYTVYSRSGEAGRFLFTLIYGTDNKHKAIKYVRTKEEEGLFLVAYCARPQEKSSKCVYVSGMQNSLSSAEGVAAEVPVNGHAPQAPAVPSSAGSLEAPQAPESAFPVSLESGEGVSSPGAVESVERVSGAGAVGPAKSGEGV